MTALVTVLTPYEETSGSKTWTTPGSTISLPSLVIQKRETDSPAKSVVEDKLIVYLGTKGTDGITILNDRIVFTVSLRRPKAAHSDWINAAKVILRDVIQSSEFDNVLAVRQYIKP